MKLFLVWQGQTGLKKDKVGNLLLQEDTLYLMGENLLLEDILELDMEGTPLLVSGTQAVPHSQWSEVGNLVVVGILLGDTGVCVWDRASSEVA